MAAFSRESVSDSGTEESDKQLGIDTIFLSHTVMLGERERLERKTGSQLSKTSVALAMSVVSSEVSPYVCIVVEGHEGRAFRIEANHAILGKIRSNLKMLSTLLEP